MMVKEKSTRPRLLLWAGFFYFGPKADSPEAPR
jgi:hypothetical protein